jgi:hypothetical protein
MIKPGGRLYEQRAVTRERTCEDTRRHLRQKQCCFLRFSEAGQENVRITKKIISSPLTFCTKSASSSSPAAGFEWPHNDHFLRLVMLPENRKGLPALYAISAIFLAGYHQK